MPAPLLNVNREAIKTLAIAHGVREAARMAGLPQATVQAWSARWHWMKFKAKKRNQPLCNQSPGDALATTLNDDRKRSTMALGTFTRRAAEIAAKHKKPLEIARKVRDVAAVHSTLWPAEQGEGILEIGLLVGKAEPVAEVSDDAPVIDVE